MIRNKKLFAILTLVCFMFTLMPVAAFASDSVTVDDGAELADAIANGGVINVTGNITTGSAFVVNNDVTINLAGNISMTQEDTVGDGVFHVTGGTLTINGEGTINGVGNNNYNMAIWADGGNVIINGGTFTNEGARQYENDGKTPNNNELIYAKRGNVTINGGEFKGTNYPGTTTAKFMLNLKDNSGASIVVKGGTFYGFNPSKVYTEPEQPLNFVATGYNVVENNGVYTVVDNNEASIGGVKYTTLAEAIEKANSGDTVTLMKDAAGSGVVINKNVTIDFDNHTYTFTTPAVGSNGTESNGFQILSGNTVTLQDGK